MAIENLGLGVVPPSESTDSSRVQKIQQLVKGGDIKKASQEFESYFISYLFKTMQKTIQKSSFTKHKGDEMYQGLYADAIGQQAAEAGGIGLGKLIESTLKGQEPNSIKHRTIG
jgi:Rod binding domain-containing protein